MTRFLRSFVAGSRRFRFVRFVFGSIALTWFTSFAGAAEPPAKMAFDIPVGSAVASLRLFSAQSGVQVIFLEDAISDVRTRGLKGEFTPADAMDRLLAGTALKAARDERSGAFAVSRTPDSEKESKLPKEVGATRADSRGRPSGNPTSDELITLTPFEVSTARDDGFVASQSLAGGRLAGDLKDTPAAYSVMTRELIDALNIIDLTEANEWMVNATSNDDRGSGELIGGVVMINSRGVSANNPSRNFFLLPVNFDSYNLDRYDFSRGPNAILFGESTFGGSSNVITKTARTDRDFGRANLTFSSWESSRAAVDMNKTVSPNAALRFNGVVHNSHGYRLYEGDRKQAGTLDLLWRPFRNTEIRVEGEKGRVDRNKPMTPFYDFMTGWDGRSTYSTLQTGTIPQANSRGVTKYGSSTAPYFVFAPGSMTRVANFANTARTFGGGSSADVPVAGVRYVGSSSPNLYQRPMNEALNVPANRFDLLYANTSFRLPGRDFALSTNEPTSKQNYSTYSVFVRQRFGSNLFAEIAANRASEQRVNNYTNYRGMNNVVLDINSTMPDGAPNPRFLEAYSDASRSRLRLGNDYKNLRAAVAYTLNDTPVGSFSVNTYGGLAPTKNYQYIESLQVVPDSNDLRSVYASGANAMRVYYRYYLSERDRPTPNPTEAFYNMNDGSGTPAQVHRVLWLGDASRETDESITTRKQSYVQGALKGVFLRNRLHLLAATRRDRLTINRKVNLGFAKYPANWDGSIYYFRPDAPPDYEELTYYIKDASGRITNPIPQEALSRPAGAQYANDRFKNDYNPNDIHSTANSHSLGGVLHVTNWFSVFGNRATSFLPTSNSRDVTGEFIPGPISKGYDMGFRLSFLNNRVYVSASHYAGDETGQIQEVTTQTNYIRNIALANKEGDYSGGLNQRNLVQPPSQTADTRDRKNRGYELELTANFTSNWRMMFNAALPRGWQFNNNPLLRGYLAKNDQLIRAVLADAGVLIDANNNAAVRPGLDPNNMAESQNAATAWNNLVQWQQNLVSGEQLINRLVKYTLNINSDYRFDHGWMNGLRVGGGVQIRGREILGYRGSDTIVDPQNPTRAIDDPAVDAYTPVYTSGYYLVSLRAGYSLKLGNRRSLEFQLNVGNVLNNTDPHYVNTTTRPPGGDLTNPSRVSTPNEFYYVLPRNFRFSTTLNF